MMTINMTGIATSNWSVNNDGAFFLIGFNGVEFKNLDAVRCYFTWSNYTNSSYEIAYCDDVIINSDGSLSI